MPTADAAAIAQQLHAWIDRAEAWVDDASRGSETVAEIAGRLRTAWRDAIAREVEARDLRFGPGEWDLLATDIDLNAQGLAVAAELKRNPPPRASAWAATSAASDTGSRG